ncbi:RING finger protein PSH1 [Phytophthora citrophthora]|uniref:RING finger protein PSH1 n=1 Tax=Phytophthora citrophthora TaxID=4793 RepID=A0AAD9GU01_9STRA|nr:RING finger protein PSH1 [Phytophthora citrophthora]
MSLHRQRQPNHFNQNKLVPSIFDMTLPLQDDGGRRQEEEEEEEGSANVEAQEDEEQEEKSEETVEEQDAEERVVVELDEQEQKQEENDDEVQFVGNAEGPNSHHKTEEKQEENEVVVVENGPPDSHATQRSKAKTDAIMAANGYVTPATLEAELQCIICQYAMFKPMSAICGHSFCRVCLMDSFLTRPIEEAQCPICRVEVLKPFSSKSSLESIFYVNVTLWNLAQLLIPSVAERILTYQEEEEREYKQKLDELEARWKIFTLEARAAIHHGDHEDDEMGSPARWEDDHEGHEDYPVLKVEDTHDGDLHVSRNVVLDTSDENEDGVMNMRVGIAIVEFPSIFELYNEHQECSVNVIKMEEDEETADGMPFFMNEDGDDDGFVCGSYYNEISLHVCDEAGNCVMERTRGARGGVVAFPGLRLDVPGGLYTFRFSDDLYGLKLSITTHLREPHEISDTPVADYVSLINDEARDGSRRNRRRNHASDSENDYDEEDNESEDSFIVDDINHEPVGRFSDEEGEDPWEYHSDDEVADEEREQRRVRRRQRSGRRSERDVEVVDEHHEGEELSGSEHEDDEEANAEVRSGRRNIRVVVDAAFSSDGEEEREECGADEVKEEDEDHHENLQVSQPRRRNANQIIDSDDEDDETAPAGSDEEQKEDAVSDSLHEESAERDASIGDETVVNENDEDGDTTSQPTRKVKRSQWFQDDESNEEDHEPHPDTSSSPGDQEIMTSRPLKRSRGRDRQVRVIDEGLSDEEQEEMERTIITTSDINDQDDDDGDDGSDTQFRRVHLYDEEENVDLHGYDDYHQDNEEDYPDEDDYQGEEDF